MPFESDSSSDRKNQIEGLTKIFAGIVIICYVLGLVSVNKYLYRVGASDFEVFRPRLLYTGALALAPILIGLGWVHSLVGQLFRWIHREPSEGTVPIFAWICASCLLVLYTYLIVHYSLVFHGFTSKGLEAISKLTYSLGVSIAVSILIHATKSTKPYSQRIPQLTANLVLFVCFFMWYAQSFADFIYPYVKQQFGGGSPQKAKLLIATDAVHGLRSIGLDFESDDVTREVTVLSQNTESYILCFRPKALPVTQHPSTSPKLLILDLKSVRAMEVIKSPSLDYCWDHVP